MKKKARLVFLIAAILLLFVSCTPYDRQRTATEGSVTCCTANFFGSGAFVVEIEWDGDPDHTVIRIPETCGGQEVIAFGGFTGTGVPTPAVLTVNGKSDGILDESAETVRLTIEFGANIKEIRHLVSTGAVPVTRGGETVYVNPAFYMVAYEENEEFYTENGHVFRKEDGGLVTGITYWDWNENMG